MFFSFRFERLLGFLLVNFETARPPLDRGGLAPPHPL